MQKSNFNKGSLYVIIESNLTYIPARRNDPSVSPSGSIPAPPPGKTRKIGIAARIFAPFGKTKIPPQFLLFLYKCKYICLRMDGCLMQYRMENGIWSRVFAVPTDLIDQHLKLCSGLSLKVLLLILRHGEMSDADLAQALGQAPADVQDALHYWSHLGVLQRGDTPPPPPMQQPSAPSLQPEPPAEGASPKKMTKLGASRSRLTTQDINELAAQDNTVRLLLQEVQEVLGKELSPVSTDTVVSLYTYYGMQPDIILMLLQYCVSQERASMRQIEKEAAVWLEKGIDTHEKAEAEILRRCQLGKIEKEVRRAFGIHDRRLGKKECQFIETWTDGYKMELPLIELAFERTVEIKGQLSFDYINGILTNWHKKGICTPAQALQEISAKRTTAPQSGAANASYNMDAVQDMITYSSILE